MNKERKRIIVSNQISQVETVQLGGYDQKILIEGKSEQLPVVITLHGGPGQPFPFSVGCRGMFPEFTNQCILVSWDQYGCGINNAELPADITIDDFASMACDLVDVMKKKYPNNKLYLFGMSWGSILAAKTALKKADCIDGVFTYGQVLHHLMRSEETVQTIENSKTSEKVKKEVQALVTSDAFSYEDSIKMSKYVRNYTQGYFNPLEPKAPIGKMIRGLLTSPDYRFRDFLGIVKNGYLKNHSLIEELSQIDLRDELSNVRIPYHIIQGDTDVVTSTKLIQAFVQEAKNEFIACTVVKDAAHMPGLNGMKAILDEIAAL